MKTRFNFTKYACLFLMLIGISVNAWGASDDVMSSFSDISGDYDSNISFEAAKGGASTAPAVNSGEIRVYQNGGTFTVTANNGVTITEIVLGSSMATTVTYAVDGGSESANKSITAKKTTTTGTIAATDNVVFTCKGTDKNSRLYINYLKVTYTSGSTGGGGGTGGGGSSSGGSTGSITISAASGADIKLVSGSNSSTGAFWANSTPLTASGITLSGSDGSTGNYAYYDGSIVRFYQNNTFTLTPASGVTITQVDIVRSTSTSSNSGTINCTGLTASSSNTSTNTNVYTGSASSAVTFTAAAQARFTAIKVYLSSTGGGGSDPTPGGSDTYNGQTITYHLTGCSKIDSDTEGNPYPKKASNNMKIGFAANSGYVLDSYTEIIVKIGSTTLTSSQYSWQKDWSGNSGSTSNYFLDIAESLITGTVDITIVAKGGTTTPITINASNHTVPENETGYVTSWFSITPAEYNGTITYSSNNEEVFWVDNEGYYWATGEGTATLTMTAAPNAPYGGGTKSITVTVTPVSSGYNVKYMVPSCVTSPSNNVTVTDETTYANISPSVAGYRFEGWTTSAISGTTTAKPGTIYKPGDAVTAAGTVYALFTKVNSEFDRVAAGTAITEGDYLIVGSYSAGSGTGTCQVLNNELDAKNRLGTTQYTVSNDVIYTTDWSCIWHISANSTYWNIYNDEVGLYLSAASGTCSPGSDDRNVDLSDNKNADLALWTIETSSITKKMTNKGFTWANGLLIYQTNGGFYSSGNAPYLFKRVTSSAQYTTNPTCDATTYSVTTSGTNGTTTAASNGGSAVARLEGLEGGETITLTATPNTGYVFTKWTVTAGGASLASTTSASTTFTMPSADVTVSATFTAKTYPVTLSKNKGPSNGSVQVTYNSSSTSSFTAPGNRAGYTNIGYFDTGVLGNGHKIMNADGTLVSGNVSGWISDGKWIKTDVASPQLETQWQPINYTITYHLNGGTNHGDNPANYTIETATITLQDPTKDGGNRFDGWYDNSSFTGDPVTGIALGSTGNKELWAKWTAVTYTDYITSCTSETEVTVYANNGSEPEDFTACQVAEGTSASICYTPTKTGYEIVGYYTGRTTSGTKVYDADGTMVLSNGAYTDERGWIYTNPTLTLYAVWQAITYEVHFNGNGNTSGAMNDNQSFNYDQAKNLLSNKFGKTGYDFAGWATSSDGDVVYSNQQNVSNLASTKGAVVELYAKWTPKTINITWDANTNGGKIDGENTKITTYTYDGASVTLPTPDDRECYTFKGWFVSATGNTQVTEVGTTRKPTSNVTYYAQWTADTYTVSFTMNGHGTKPNNQTVNCGEKATDPNTVDVSGWHLEGWYTDNGTWANKWDFANDVVTAATALYAHWVSNTHTITCQTQVGVNGAVQTFCSDIADIAAGTSNVEVTLNESCIPAGYHLYGWTVTTSKGGSTGNTPDVENKKITITTMPDADVTVTAILAPEATVTGTVALTSAVDVNAGTAVDAITISASDITPVQKIRIKYRNNKTREVWQGDERGNSAFRLKDATYNVADGGSGNIDVATVYGGSNTHSFTMVYSPKAENTTDDYTMIVELLGNDAGSIIYDTKELPLSGRSLPNTFVVATKYNGMWYALPNNMDAAGTYAPVLINVDEENKVAYGPATAGYGLNTYLSTNNVPLNFVGANDKCLWASSASEGEGTNIRNYADKAAAGSEPYAWVLTTSDMESYTMSPLNTVRYLRYWNDKWGMFTSGNTDMHFYPLQEVTPMTVTPTTWGMGWVEVAASTNPGTVNLIINGDNETVTATETAEDGIYRLTDGRIGVATNSCREMAILKGGQQAIVKMPMIVASDKAATVPSEVWTGVGLTVEGCKDCDIVVTNGATLSYTNSSSAVSMGKMAVYAGARLVDENDNLTWDALDIRREGDVVGSARLNGANGTRPVNFTWTFDEERWYWFTLPMASTTANATFLNGSPATLANHWYLAEYDGAQRVIKGDGDNWPFCEPTTLTPGKGYIIAWDGIPSGYTKQTLVMPMTGYTENENKSVTVYAYGAGTGAAANRVGWNVIGDPYLEYYGTKDGNPFTALLTGSVSRVDGTWTRTGSVPYVTIPINGGEDYYQQLITEADLSPFTSFFVQIGGSSDGEELELVFNSSKRDKRNVVARASIAESNPIIATLVLSNSDNQSDETSMVVWENFNDTYEVGGDLVKMKGDSYKSSNRPTLYSLHESGELAFQATNKVGAARTNPLGYYTRLNGEHVFSLKDNVDESLFESIILVDNELSVRHNLLVSDYTFSATAEENTTRFGVEIHLREGSAITTGVQNGIENSDITPRKFIFQDKMYIQIGNVIYDATGKLVNNK